MTTYAEHLEGAGEILASVRQVAQLADDIAGSGRLPRHPGTNRLVESHAAFRKAYGDATVEGISDEDDARDLLRDAVNVALSLADAYAANGGDDRILNRRAEDVREEFKPTHRRHHGLTVGDRVEQRVGSLGILTGEVTALDPLDNNRATIRDDRDGEDSDVTCDCCVQMPTFRSRVSPPSPSPR